MSDRTVTSLTNPTVKAVRALHLRKERDETGLFVAEGLKIVTEAIETAVPVRRCTAVPGRAARTGPCAPAQLGVAHCPCAGDIGQEAYADVIATIRRGLLEDPGILLSPLEARMHALAAAGALPHAGR